MPRPRTQAAQPAPTTRSRVTNGRALLTGLDGRAPLYRRYRDLLAELETDMGASRMTAVRASLVRRFAEGTIAAEVMAVELIEGRAIDVAVFSQLASTLVRLASRIGLTRAQKIVPSLDEYIRKNEGEIIEPKEGADD
jgi:type IV pilus biogenesis protein CpaD/CtpE